MTNQSDVVNYGVVKCYYAFKGFGFITREAGKDVFFLYKDVASESDIFEGVRVTFEVINEGKGPRAKNVTRVG